MPKRLPVPVEVGRRIRTARERSGLTRDELAGLADLDSSQLGKIERGEGDPRLTTLVRVAGAFGTDPSDFLSGIGRDYLPETERRNLTVPEFLADLEQRGGRRTRRGRDRA